MMKIINTQRNVFLGEASHKLGVGFLTGPIRVIAAIAQIALNGIGLIFAVIPSMLGCLKDSSFHVKILLRDTGIGFLHIGRGFLEFLPGSSFFMDMIADGRMITLTSDHPFYGIIED